MKKSADPSNPLESEEQATLVEWLELKGWRFTSLAQSTFSGHLEGRRWVKHHRTNTNNRSTGVRPGFPDMCVITGRGLLAFVEMKRRKGVPSDVKPDQRKWINALLKTGTPASACFGFQEAKDFLEAVDNGRWEDEWGRGFPEDNR